MGGVKWNQPDTKDEKEKNAVVWGKCTDVSKAKGSLSVRNQQRQAMKTVVDGFTAHRVALHKFCKATRSVSQNVIDVKPNACRGFPQCTVVSERESETLEGFKG